MIYSEVQKGCPKGSVKAVIDAYADLVDQGCLVVFGPNITDNCVPVREAIEERFKVPAISVTGTDDWLGEWTFAFPQGSMTDEPIFIADLLAKRNLRQVGVLVEQSLIGQGYPDQPAKCLPPQRNPDRRGVRGRPDRAGHHRRGTHPARGQIRGDRAPGIRLRDRVHQPGAGGVGVGSAAVHHDGLPERLDVDHVAGIPGLDRCRPVRRGQPDRPGFLDRYAEKYGARPEYCVSVVNRDVAETLVRAFSDAHPLTRVA